MFAIRYSKGVSLCTIPCHLTNMFLNRRFTNMDYHCPGNLIRFILTFHNSVSFLVSCSWAAWPRILILRCALSAQGHVQAKDSPRHKISMLEGMVSDCIIGLRGWLSTKIIERHAVVVPSSIGVLHSRIGKNWPAKRNFADNFWNQVFPGQ